MSQVMRHRETSRARYKLKPILNESFILSDFNSQSDAFYRNSDICFLHFIGI